ncbi:MAG: methyltransferase domain-containing protein [Gemmatimonadaceae bacterium]
MIVKTEHPESAQPAGYYDEYWSGATGWRPPGGLDADLKAWLDRLVRPGAKILDVGCGDGARYGRHLRAAGVLLSGVDVSEVAVQAARSNGIDATVVNLDERLPFPDGTFDGVICLEVLEHLVDPEFTARDVLRLLRPGGHLLVSVPNVGFWAVRMELLATGHFNPKGNPVTQRRYPWRDPHLRFFNSQTLRSMLTDVGFRVERHGGLEQQFLRVAGLERIFASRAARPLDALLRRVGGRFHSLLARRCVALAVKPDGRAAGAAPRGPAGAI